MKIAGLITALIILISSACIFTSTSVRIKENSRNNIQIDTSRFSLKMAENKFLLIENLQNDTLSFNKQLLVNSNEELDEEQQYVSSFSFSKKTNSFIIGNGLIGIQLVSFSAMTEGSAHAAAGRDLFLIYNSRNDSIYSTILDLGITKQRQRYMGCLSAKTSHFILSDMNFDGLIDIGVIKEELKCESSDPDMISGPFFIQNPIEWYIFKNNAWSYDSLKILPASYIELPLVEINFNPVDFFGNMKWKSYDPKSWDKKAEVYFYPRYRLQLINSQKPKKVNW